MALYSIGAFQFFTLIGTPEPPKRDLEIIARQGVNGVAVWDTGTRGHPFTVRSQVDQRDLEHAWTTWHEYVAEIGEVRPLYWASITPVNYKVLIKDVTDHRIKPIAPGSSGGYHFPSLAWLEATWTLIAIPESE